MYARAGSSLRFAILFAVFLAGSAYAQNATGAINGTVKDQNDALITNAVVTATNKTTGASRTLNTKSEGGFVFENLLPGEYVVKVEAQGFSTQTQTLIVEVGTTTTSAFSMTVGQASQTVEVTAESPVINTTDTTVGGIINRDRVESLPLNGRSFLSIALLEPGVNVNYAPNSGPGNVNNFFQVSVGSAPQSMTHISVDGARVNDRITGGTSQNFSAETVQEFQISTLGFDLSSGTVSAGAVNIVSRTGSNKYHGSSFFYFRDHNMAAYPGFTRDPFDPDPFFVRKQYGGTFSGPLKKDQLFFFTNYERTDQIGARTVTFEEPRLLGFNHVAQQPFKGHQGGFRLDYTASQKHTGFLRASVDNNQSMSGTGLESRWIASDNFSYQTQMGVTSVLRPTLVNDFRFSYSYFRNHLAVPSQEQCERAARNPVFCFGLGGPQITFFGGLVIGNNVNTPQDRHPRTYQWTDNVNWTKGSHRLRFGGNWEHSNNHGTWARLASGVFAAFGPEVVAARAPAIYNALPASLKPGSTARPTFQELLQLPMTNTLTVGVGSPLQPAPWRFDEILANDHIRFYFQDGWQARPGFTLNYGLAWSFENNIVYHDLDIPRYIRPLLGNDLGGPKQDYNNFDPALGFAWAVGKEKKTVIRSSTSLHHISPNVGFYNLNQRILLGPAGNGLQSATGAALPNPEVPGGVLNFPTTPTNFTLADMLAYLPAARSILEAETTRRFNGQDLSVRGIEVTKTASGLDALYNNNFVTPYTIHVNAGVQREIVRNLAVSADYVMRRGVKFGAFEGIFPDLNRWNRFSSYTLNPTTGVATAVRNPLLPACTAAQRSDPAAQCSNGPIQYGMPFLLSRYSAFQVKVDKRFSHGFQLSGAYALSRYWAVANISNFDNLHEGHGISGNNPRHRFTFSGIWDLPRYNGEHRFLRGLLRDWQVSTIMEMRTGAPTSVTVCSCDNEGDGSFTFRLPGTTVSSFGYNLSANDIRRLVEEYNAKFPAPKDTPLSGIGRANRDFVGTAYPYIVLPDKFAFADSFLTHDLRVTRHVRIAENIRLTLIGEGFNIFNIANLTGFAGGLDAYIRPTATTPGRDPLFTFGQPTGRVSPVFGSGGPRAFQLAARISF
jgi:hypothetical protein